MVYLLWEYPAEPYADNKVLGVYGDIKDAEKDMEALRQAGTDSTLKIISEKILTKPQGITTVFSGLTQPSQKETELLTTLFGEGKVKAAEEAVDIFEAEIEKLETLAINGPRVNGFDSFQEVDLCETLPGQVKVWGSNEEKVRAMILSQKLHFALLKAQDKKDQE